MNATALLPTAYVESISNWKNYTAEGGIYRLMTSYRKYPIDVARTAYLKALDDGLRYGNWRADAADIVTYKTLLTDLMLHEDALANDIGKLVELLLFRVFRSDLSREEAGRDFPASMLEFALELYFMPTQDNLIDRRWQIMKAVLNRFAQSAYLYPLIPSMPRALRQCLYAICPKHILESDWLTHEYSESDWNQAYKAMGLIAALKELAFVEHLKQLGTKYADKQLLCTADDTVALPLTPLHRFTIAGVVLRILNKKKR